MLCCVVLYCVQDDLSVAEVPHLILRGHRGRRNQRQTFQRKVGIIWNFSSNHIIWPYKGVWLLTFSQKAAIAIDPDEWAEPSHK